jgi:hypothetical protein
MPLTQDEPRHGLVEASIARGCDVGFRGLPTQHSLLCTAHGRQNGRVTLIVTVDTHTQINLPRVRIGPEETHEAKNGVNGQALQPLEHRRSPSPRTSRGGIAIVADV